MSELKDLELEDIEIGSGINKYGSINLVVGNDWEGVYRIAYINRAEAIAIVAHLTEVFDLTEDEVPNVARELPEELPEEPAPLLVPKHFVHVETGLWLPYKEEGFTQEQLDKAIITKPGSSCDSDVCDRIKLLATYGDKRYTVHALAFGDPKLDRRNFPRWDVVNGWTTPIGEDI